MDLALNTLQRLICHKTRKTNHNFHQIVFESFNSLNYYVYVYRGISMGAPSRYLLARSNNAFKMNILTKSNGNVSECVGKIVESASSGLITKSE